MKWLSKTYIWVIMAFLYAPIGVLIFFSFNQSKSRSNFTGFYAGLVCKTVPQRSDYPVFDQYSDRRAGFFHHCNSHRNYCGGGDNSMKNWKRSIIMNITYLPIVNPEIVIGSVF